MACLLRSVKAQAGGLTAEVLVDARAGGVQREAESARERGARERRQREADATHGLWNRAGRGGDVECARRGK